MLRIQGQTLKPKDRKILSEFAKWVLDKFVIPSVQQKATILVEFIDPKTLPKKEQKELHRYKAWLIYNGKKNEKRNFTITIEEAMLLKFKNAKNPILRLEAALECLGHELIHIKQYLNGETFDYKEGDVRFRGERFTNWEKGEAYWFSPWELEAYGYEQGLYAVFKEKFKGKFKG